MGLVSGIFNSISELSRQLGGSDFRSIWSSGRGSVSENEFQNEQLFKFTDEYAVQQQSNKLSNFLDFITQRKQEDDNFINVQNFFETKKQVEVNFLDSQIQEAESFRLPSPVLRRVGALDRSTADFYYKGSGSFKNLHPVSQQNLVNIDYNKQVTQQLNDYSIPIYNEIKGFIENLTSQKSLIQSKSLF